MSNGILSRKGMIAILASVMFTMTACSDKNKVRDLEGENGRLKQELTEIADAKKTAEQKLAETETAVAALQDQVNKYESAESTIADLVTEIKEKEQIVADLQDLIESLEVQKVEAKEMIRQAGVTSEMAKGEMNAALRLKADAKKRLEKIAKQEENIKGIIEDLADREEKVERAAKQWKELYAEHKVDAVFDRLTSEGKIKDELTFQFSVVAINVSSKDVLDIRSRVNKVAGSNSNIYKNDKKLSPSTYKVTDKRKAVAKAERDDSMTSKALSALKGFDSFTMNDSYMALANAESIIKLRDDLKAWNKDDKAVFIVPRLIEKLSISLKLKVNSNAAKKYSPNQNDRVMREIVDATLMEPTEVEVDLSKRIDVTLPMGALVSNADCKELNAACIKGLNEKSLLNKIVENKKTGDKVVLKQYLRAQFLDSSDQMSKDFADLSGNGIESDTFMGMIFGSGKELQCLTASSDGSEAVMADCTPEQIKARARQATIEDMELTFSVNMVQDMPRNGYVPVDFAVNDKFKDIAGSLSKGKIHIELPIKEDRSVKFDAKTASEADVTSTYPDNSDIVKFTIRGMSAKSEIYKDFANALK